MVVNALVTSSISTVGEKLANKISEAKTGENPISTASGYIAHAALGCALGAARQIAAGGDSNENVP
ncbi:hypothetical protein MHN79_20700 [Vibrio sp. Of14-4]|uniref:hypothetical protein n=1 Tax=Vibrio sp. Of14-4 TaxID=2724878 RepID=UPI001EF33E5D|nr:hypothetical protein [Vibrio sp. Of14-4]MCG7491892.1 hypothetical protein [Vibrio sp. Of14-4]